MANGKKKISGRDSANLRAEGWSKPNLSDLKGITVGEKCSNQELFEKIKELVSKSILILYGTKNDEKYVKIVNLIMLRVRGALSKIDANLNTASEQQQDILKKAVEDITKYIDDEQASTHKDIDDELKEFTQSLLKSITDSLDKHNESALGKDKYVTKQKESSPSTTANEKTKPKNELEERGSQATKAAAIESIDRINEAFVRLEDLNKLQDTLNENFQKIQQIIASTPITTNIENTVTNTIVSASKEATKPIDELNQMVQPVQTAKMLNEKIEQKRNAEKDGSAFSKKQFIELKKMFINADVQLKLFMFDAAAKIVKKTKNIEKRMLNIEKALKKSKISLTTIMLFASLFLLPFIINSIWPYISMLIDKIDFDAIITKIIHSIDWEKHVNDVIDNVWEEVKKKFNEVVNDPLKWVIDSFTECWNTLTKWKDDIWEWITSKFDVFKKKSEDDQKAVEASTTQKFQESMQKLEEHTDAGVNAVQQTCNETVDKASSDMVATAQSIKDSADEVQRSSVDAIQSTGETVKATSSEISNSTLPAMQTQVTQSASNAVNGAESRLNENISSSERKLSGELENLEKTTKENGAPTNVSTTTLTQMESAGEGAEIAQSDIDAQVKQPETLASTITTENNKQVQLYARKDDIEKAAKDNSEVVKLQQNAGVEATAMPNVQLQTNVQKNIHGKIVVNAPSTSNTMSSQAMYKDMDASIGEVTRVASIIDVGLKSNSGILQKIKSNVEEYFTEINEMVKIIRDKKSTVNNNSLVVQSSNTPLNSATMDKF